MVITISFISVARRTDDESDFKLYPSAPIEQYRSLFARCMSKGNTCIRFRQSLYETFVELMPNMLWHVAVTLYLVHLIHLSRNDNVVHVENIGMNMRNRPRTIKGANWP